MRNTVTNCTPRCIGDGQCPSNEKCCPNKCGHTSVAGGTTYTVYKIHINQDVYCNGVRCAAYEKCQYDRNTRRDKCTRV
ncbi:hypothetical protein ALC62_11147 [Cyphomyrmex costatus]|uniref:WAP domain-containing protein n=1 Tax=Cyphomyrmex costatus TaxID=456900 RepID=A0A195CD67_9HYME|nr:hypothetical protein ALC62_11147 [Cyphomyrmex costatus]